LGLLAAIEWLEYNSKSQWMYTAVDVDGGGWLWSISGPQLEQELGRVISNPTEKTTDQRSLIAHYVAPVTSGIHELSKGVNSSNSTPIPGGNSTKKALAFNYLNEWMW